MRYDIIKISWSILKLILYPGQWKYRSAGYCPSCNKTSIIVYSKQTENHLSNFISGWDSGSQFKEQLLERENNFCGTCNANYRMKALAETVVKLLGMGDTGDLIKRLTENAGFRVYETSAYLVFRTKPLKEFYNYVVSEYADNRRFGVSVNGIRNENLECLTFPDNTFDVLMNSDVLEHVHDLAKALSEIRRVLKPGGFHIFTVPVDHELHKTRQRARIIDGEIKHFLSPIMHGDSTRAEGILVYRDFGKDVLDYMSTEGFACKEFNYFNNEKYITSVYYEQKS